MLALLLVAGVFFAGNAEAQGKPASPDAAITTRVQGALARDPFLGSMPIRVETQGGVVNLTGFVRSIEDVAKAGDLARRVSGVSAVRNGLRVQNHPSRA